MQSQRPKDPTERPRSEVTAFTRSREPEVSRRPRSEGVASQATPRSGQTEDAGADGAVGEASLSSTKVATGLVDSPTSAACERTDTTGSTERLLSTGGVQTRSDAAGATETVSFRAAATTVPTAGYVCDHGPHRSRPR